MGEFTLADIENVIEKAIKPLADDISEIKLTLFGNEGRTGLVLDVSEAHTLAKKHETMLRGRDGTSGMVKKMNYLWVVAGGAWATGILSKAWEYLSSNPPPHH